MKKNETSLLDTIVGMTIGIPIALIILILASPVILYLSIVKGPILSLKRRKFLKRNSGKIILCISPGGKYKLFQSTYHDELMSIGIHDIVVFDPTKPNNHYDHFKWDGMISRSLGFPILLKFTEDQVTQQSLKNEFIAFFKKEIDLIQLKGCIKRIVDGKSY
ncbi:MAG TPA: hypothetical protein VIM65_07875 [Cyclobacteriaceae bacterium]